MKAALRELDGSVESPDPATKRQQPVRLDKAAPHLLSPHAPHLPSPHEVPLDLAMKLEERLE